jgi:sugar porter (SP) family MFS transporter
MATHSIDETRRRWIGMVGAGAARKSGALTAEEIAAGRITPALIMTGLVSAIASLLYGYDTGIISGALLQIREDFGVGIGWESVIASSILLGAIIGALSCSRLSEVLGRKRTLLLISVVFMIGTTASSLSSTPLLLSLSRIILGFAVGGATQTVPMYVAELSPPRRRGALVLTFQVGIGVGILTATIVGALQLFPWRVAIGMAVVPATVLLLLGLLLPESPRWLVERDRYEEARSVLTRIRPAGVNVKPELQSIIEIEQEELGAGERSGWSGLFKPWVRPALIVGCGIAAFTQLSGIEMIVYFAPTILTGTGFSTTAALDVSVGLGLSYLVMQIVGMAIVDKVGRRRLTLIMVPGAAISLFVLGTLFITGKTDRGTIGFIIASIILFMLFNAGGLQLMGWLTGSEIYPLAVRGAGTSAQSTTLWGTNLLITVTLLPILSAIGAGVTMWMYGIFNVIAWLFVFKRMPELTGHSLEQIEQQLHFGKFRPKDFAALREEGQFTLHYHPEGARGWDKEEE